MSGRPGFDDDFEVRFDAVIARWYAEPVRSHEARVALPLLTKLCAEEFADYSLPPALLTLIATSVLGELRG